MELHLRVKVLLGHIAEVLPPLLVEVVHLAQRERVDGLATRPHGFLLQRVRLFILRATRRIVEVVAWNLVVLNKR